MPDSHRSALPTAGITHPRVRDYLQIKRNRPGSQPGAVALEGLWAIRHAVDAPVRLDAVFVCNTLVRGDDTDAVLAELVAGGTPAWQVSTRVLRRMVDRDGPDGLAAIARLPTHRLDDIAVGDETCLVIADGFELLGNLGTLIRCADGAGASAVVVTDRRARTGHPLVVRASMGTVFSMPVVESELRDVLAWLRSHRVRVIAADPEARASYRSVEYHGPLAIVLGNERHGLAAAWRDAADVAVSIPMLGTADSLNVSVAGALLLYEALHRRTARARGSLEG